MTPHQFMNFAQDFHAKRRKDEQWLRHKSQYNNANYEDFSRNYDAVINNQTKPDDWVKNYAFGNSLTAGITDTAATWLAGGARLLGLTDAANKLDNVKQQIRIHQDVNRGDSGFSNFVYGAGTIAPELLLPAGQIKLGAGLLKNARNAALWGAPTSGLTSALDSDKSWGQAGWDTLYGGVGGGLLGGIGSSVLGHFNGYGLLNRAKNPTPSSGLLDSEIAKGIREEMGIQRPTHWQTTAPQQQANIVGQSHWYPNAAATAQDNVRLKIADNVQMSVKPPFDMKTMHKLKAAAVNAPTATQQQYEMYYRAMWSGDKEQLSKTLPFIKIAHFSEPFSKLFGLEKDAVFFTKQSMSHVRASRKEAYNQDLPEAFVRDIPNIINNAQGGFYDKAHRNFFIVKPLSDYGIDSNQLGFIHFNKDILGNYIVTMKRADAESLSNANYVEVGRGIAPHIPTEQNSIASPFLKASPTSSNANPTTPNINVGLDDTQYSMQMSSSLRGREDEAINNVGSPTREIATHSVNARNDIGSVHNLTNNIATQAASNAVAGTAGGIANVALDDSDDALALKFAKGFAYGVMGKVAAKHGMPAATKAGKAAFDYAMKQTTELRTLWRENPQLWTRFLNKQLTDDFAQFGGQKAGLHVERFAVAQTLASKGVGETEILERTGWFKGLDGHWKFQIDLSNGAAYKLKEGTYSLSQLFKQPSLYLAYPFLKKMRVSIQTMPENVNGYFDMPTLTIHLNSANNKFDFTQALSHEVQHIIQQYEGFAVGTSKSNPNYWTNAGEVEARATFKAGENNPQQRLNNELEEGRLIQEFEKQANQSSLRTSNASAAINNQGSPNSLADEHGRLPRSARNDIGGARNDAIDPNFAPQSSLRGEAEAINNVGSPTREIAAHSVNARNDAIAQKQIQQGIMDNEVFQRRLNNIPKDKQQAYLQDISEHIATKFPNHDSQTAINAHLLMGEIRENYAWARKNKADEVSQPLRQELETLLNIHPLKEFGTNYAEFYHDGQNAINKLMHEKQGQVAGAFYREDLQRLSGNGNIDLVWGDSRFGLAHILDKHAKEFKNIAEDLNEIVEKGVLEKAKDNKYTLKTPKHTLVLGQRENSDFIITAYKDKRNEKLGNHQTGVGDDFTDEPLAKTPLSSNQNDIIPQNPNTQQYSFETPIAKLKNAAARIEGIKAFAKYLANPPEHLRADAQRLRADRAAMAELDMHTRKAATDKANAIDELAYQMGYPEPQYSMKNPRQKEKFKEDSVGLVEQIRSSSKAFADKILHSKWVDVPLGTRIYTKGFEDYRGIKDSFDRDIAANTSAALDLHNKLKLLSEDNQRKMYQYMSGDLKGEELTKDIRELADEFRKVVRKETDELVKLGLLDEETAKKWGDMNDYTKKGMFRSFLCYNSFFLKGCQ